MNENLAEMVRNESSVETPNIFNPDDLVEEETVVADEESAEVNEETVEEVVDDGTYIPTALLSEWFEINHTNFENINRVRIELNRVRPNRSIITTILDPDATDELDRKVCMFEDADRFNILNLESSDFHMYGINKFRVVYNYNDNISIKCYGTKTILFVLFCINVNDQLIPYSKQKIKVSDENVLVIEKDPAEVIQTLTEPADFEDLQLLYKPIAKAEDIVTKQDAVNWFFTVQEGIIDINHLLKIDDIMIKMFE